MKLHMIKFQKSLRYMQYKLNGGHRYLFQGDWERTQLKDVIKSDRNFYGGNNSVSQAEYLTIRPTIRRGLSTETDLQFLKQIDKRFGLRLPKE